MACPKKLCGKENRITTFVSVLLALNVGRHLWRVGQAAENIRRLGPKPGCKRGLAWLRAKRSLAYIDADEDSDSAEEGLVVTTVSVAAIARPTERRMMGRMSVSLSGCAGCRAIAPPIFSGLFVGAC